MRSPAWIVVVMAGASPLAGYGADRDEDEEQNLAILRELPSFPGARELEVVTAPYYGDEEGPFDHAECRVERLGAIGDPDAKPRAYLELHCQGATASIAVSPDNLTTSKSSFDVVADHRGGPG